MKEYVTTDLCEERHVSSRKDIEDIKSSLRWMNRQLILGLLGIIGILIMTIWNGHGKQNYKLLNRVEASTNQ